MMQGMDLAKVQVGASKAASAPVPPRAAPRGAYRSRFGGLWTDRTDAQDLRVAMLADGRIDANESAKLEQYIAEGYVVFPGAVDAALVDEYLAYFESCWSNPPSWAYAHSGGQVLPMDVSLYDKVAKVSDLHYGFKRAGELIHPPAVRRFLELIYARPPVVFQSMSMRKGSEETLHIDTGPLTLTEPMSLTASWTALEDVQKGSGEFQFVPGSQALPEVLNHGLTKGHGGDMTAYYEVLQETLRRCDKAGLKTEYFYARKGDVLIWSADLMHGGAPIQNTALTRKSFVCHFMPYGVMPTFYDFSAVNYVPYAAGGYCLDRVKV